MPGREIIQVRVEIPPGSVFPSHTHPGEEVIYVIEGAWEYTITGKPLKATAGDVLFVPAGAIHSAKNVGTGNAVELATYIVEKGGHFSPWSSERPIERYCATTLERPLPPT